MARDRHYILSAKANQPTRRNTVISLLRLAGHTNLAKATRHQARAPHRPIDLLLNS